ncbi:MAG: SDR family oxidoreductase [Burkholderiales bacterium]|nr:SDR family oxidoreductase [Burkholderiales bacterium]
MDINGKHILITGAAGGIGSTLAMALAKGGASLLLADRTSESLEEIRTRIEASGGKVKIAEADLLDPSGPLQLAELAIREGIDILVNLAGIMSFRLFQEETPESIERLFRVNTIAPMLLINSILPHLLKKGSGRIVNVGSVYGSIAFPCFASYSASKFAVRGLSEALRRELEGTGVGVTYVGPRYVKTPINAGAVSRMSEAMKVNMDEPEVVAAAIVSAIEQDKSEQYIGFPESLFVRINAILPALVDGSIRKQTPAIREYAAGNK